MFCCGIKIQSQFYILFYIIIIDKTRQIESVGYVTLDIDTLRVPVCHYGIGVRQNNCISANHPTQDRNIF